jgi:hypothetical protein
MNQTAIFRIFDLADNSSASFAEQLLEQGIGSRADARPFAMQWASKKYTEPMKDGQRGLTFKRRGTSAEQAVTRVLQVCFPSADLPKPKAKRTVNKVDAVEKLLKAYANLTGAEKRRFKSAL